MKYGVISDIHANYHAMKNVLGFLYEEKVDLIINCGDVVGYGPQPNRCIEVIRNKEKCLNIMGNHDWAVAWSEDMSNFRSTAGDVVRWTKENISEENLSYLKSLKSEKELDEFMFVHGSPMFPLSEYIFTEKKAAKNFKKMKKGICFVGHTHTPVYYEKNKENKVKTFFFEENEPVILQKNSSYIVNVGSVGQPRDGNPFASVCIYDSDSSVVRLNRVEYDIKKTQEEIQAAGIPQYLAKRLSMGR